MEGGFGAFFRDTFRDTFAAADKHRKEEDVRAHMKMAKQELRKMARVVGVDVPFSSDDVSPSENKVPDDEQPADPHAGANVQADPPAMSDADRDKLTLVLIKYSDANYDKKPGDPEYVD